MKKERKIVYCDKCGNEFFLDSVKVNETNVECIGENLILKYFVCPKCDTIYVVSLLDDECIRLQNDFEQAEKKLRKNRNNAGVYSLLSTMVSKKLCRLKKHEDRLKQRFNGTFTFASENNDKENKIIYRENNTENTEN